MFYLRSIRIDNEGVIAVPEFIVLYIINLCKNIIFYVWNFKLTFFSVISCSIISFIIYSLAFCCYQKLIIKNSKKIFFKSYYFAIYIMLEWILRIFIFWILGLLFLLYSNPEILNKTFYAYGIIKYCSIFAAFDDKTQYSYYLNFGQSYAISLCYYIFVIWLLKKALNTTITKLAIGKVKKNKNLQSFYLYLLLSVLCSIFANLSVTKNNLSETNLFLILIIYAIDGYFEEIIYRNFMLRILSIKTPFFIANIIHSCIFTASHFVNPTNDLLGIFIGNFSVCILIGIIWKKYGIKYSFLLHFISNSVLLFWLMI